MLAAANILQMSGTTGTQQSNTDRTGNETVKITGSILGQNENASAAAMQASRNQNFTHLDEQVQSNGGNLHTRAQQQLASVLATTGQKESRNKNRI